jgi:chitodextrinase
VPAVLTTTVVSSSQINLTWTASTDPVVTGQITSGVAGYKVFQNGVQVATTPSTSYSATGLNDSTSYSFTVSAYDGAGNSSSQSATATATTQAASVTTSSMITNSVTTASSITSNVNFAVNAGGTQYTDSSGVGYQADANYSGGVTTKTTSPITGTTDSTVYQTQRYGNFSYSVPITNGNYIVTLKFAETYWNSTGSRTFNVRMQGNQVIANLDVFAHVGKNAAYDVTVPVNVTNGVLNINFTSLVDNAIVSAIVITNAQTPAYAVNAGGTQYTDSSGIGYQADTNYSGGVTVKTTLPITGTTDSTVYQTQRYGNFSYNVPITNGNYVVTLKFAETYWNLTGSRIFNVSMQGNQVITNLDVFANAGKNAAYDVTVPVNVTNGVLNINFTSLVDNAIVSAITVTSSTSASAPPSVDTTAPSAPSGLTATTVSSSQINIAWTPSADPTVTGQNTSGVAGYIVYINGIQVATTTAASYSATGLNASTSYSFTVSAYDVAGNSSSQSAVATATTQTTIPNTQQVVQSNVVYKADTGHTGGVIYSTAAGINGTVDDTLYQSQRLGNFSYSMPLANGNYSVTLKFDEIYFNSAGSRIFNVSMQGNQVITNLDVFANAGMNAAYDVTVPVNVTNGVLTIDFTSIKDNAMVSAITVTNGQTVVYAVNAGGGQFVDHSGVVYNADISYSGGITASTTAMITGAAGSTLYQSQRLGNFSADIPLANGNYSVTLKFAEIYFNSAGSRIFNVSMQGNQVITNLDVFAHVGENAAYDVTVPVSVTNGILHMDFSPIKDNAMVSAITVSPN